MKLSRKPADLPTPALPTLGSDISGPTPLLLRMEALNREGRREEARLELVAILMVRHLIKVADGVYADDDASVAAGELVLALKHVRLKRSAEVGFLASITRALATPPPLVGGDVIPLVVTYTDWLFLRQRWEEALVLLKALSQFVGANPEPTIYCMLGNRMARLLRRIRRLDEALLLYQAVIRCAGTHALHRFRLRALSGEGLSIMMQGNLPEARVRLKKVLQDRHISEFPNIGAAVLQDLSLTMEKMGLIVASAEYLHEALRLYKNPVEYYNALGDLGVKLSLSGELQTARHVLNVVIDKSDRWNTRVNAMIELLGLDVSEHNEVGYKRNRRFIEHLFDDMPPSMQADFLVQLARAADEFGDGIREEILVSALRIAEEHDLHEWIFRIEARLKARRALPEPLVVTGDDRARLAALCQKVVDFV